MALPAASITSSQKTCSERLKYISRPLKSPPKMRNGTFCMEAKGSRLTTAPIFPGKKGRGMTAPLKKSKSYETISRIP